MPRNVKSRIVTMLRLATQIGNFLSDKQHVTLSQLAHQKGDRFRIRLGFGNAVFFSDPVAVSEALSLDSSKMATGIARQRLAGMFPSQCLLYADGDTHLRMRKVIAKAFGKSAKSLDLHSQFEKLALRIGQENNGDPTDQIYDFLVALSSHLILGVAPKQICQDGKRVMAQFARIPTSVVLFPFLRRLPRYQHGFDNYHIAQQRLADGIASHSDVSPNCFLSALKSQQANGLLTHTEVIDNASFFFLVMIRTLSTLFSNVARTLAVESQWQERLRYLSSTNSQQVCQQRRAVIKETIRLFPFAPIYVRRAMVNLDIDGFKVKVGEYVVFSPDLIHHRDLTFPNPTKFSPERFLKRQSHGSFVPFGGGTRHCIGSGWVIDSMAELLKNLLPIVEFHTDDGHFGQHDFAMNTIFRTPRRRGFRTRIRSKAIEWGGASYVPATNCEAV